MDCYGLLTWPLAISIQVRSDMPKGVACLMPSQRRREELQSEEAIYKIKVIANPILHIITY